MTPADTGLTLPGTAEQPAPRSSAAVSDLLAQAGDLAGRTERANRPVSLIYLSGAILALALFMLAYFLFARFTASSRLGTESERAARIERLVARMKDYDRINEERREEMRPLPTMQTQIADAAVAAQLKTKLAPAQPGSGQRTGDLVRRTWKYSDLHEESLEKVFDWISRSQRDIPGLELIGLTLRPEATTWRVEVVFGRWERTGS
ncbi:MAG: hypothetical protein JNM86_14440 [Phycisphaerae bacterium]|nr:hypothetical protein [Phycisphaerae bacterium]MBN8596915.1 hypothetical protein [Planctomycetota bacterium]